MAEEIALKLTVDTVNAAQSVAELRQIIRDAAGEALRFGEGTKEFAQFGAVAAAARQKLEDFRKQMQLLDPNTQVRAFTQLGSTMLGAFTAAKGAAELFGASSDDVAKQLVKIQAAMALLQGFQAIQEGIQTFGALRAVVLSTIASMDALTIAIAATGIGAFAVILGAAIYQLNKVADAAQMSIPEYTDLEVEIDKLKVKYQNLTGAISDLEAKLADVVIDHEKAVNKIQRDAQDKLNSANSFWGQLKDNFVAFTHQYFGIKLGSVTAEETIERDKNKALDEENTRFQLEQANAKAEHAKEEIKADKKKADDEVRIEQEKNKKLREEDQKNQTTQKLDDSKALTDYGVFYDALLGKFVDFTNKEAALQKKRVTNAVTASELIQRADAIELKIKQQIAAAKIKTEENVFSVISGLGNIFIKNQQKLEQFQKKAAAVQVLVDQAQAISTAIYAANKAAATAAGILGPAYPFYLAAQISSIVAGVVASFGAVKQLLSKAGSSSDVSLETGIGVSTSSFQSSSAGVNFLNQPQTTLPGNNNQPPPPPIIIHNVISETDISRVQAVAGSIKAQATIH